MNAQLPTILQPLPYQIELRDYFRSEETALWNWFSSAQAQTDYAESLHLDLLKSTYRLDPETHSDLFRTVEEVKKALELEIPVTVYQAHHAPQPNAALYFMRGEGQLVLSGPILTLLATDELKSLIGHELAHYHLWTRDDGDFHVVDRILQSIAQDPRAEPSHLESGRCYQLYTEIFADRGSLVATGNINPVVSSLVKLHTGLSQVSAASYLKQAEEVFAKSKAKTTELSHPEAFMRVRALALWDAKDEKAPELIDAMIRGSAELEQLDLLGQVYLTKQTRQILEIILLPKWMRTEPVLAHAKMFFADIRPATDGLSPIEGWKISDPKLREYFSYLLLDFVVADPELEEMPLMAALELSKSLEIQSIFEKLVTKELKVKAKDLKRLKEQAPEMLSKAEVAA
jgi:hypothetical protein